MCGGCVLLSVSVSVKLLALSVACWLCMLFRFNRQRYTSVLRPRPLPFNPTQLSPELFRGKEVIWFVDNEAAVASLIRGAAKPEDVDTIAQVTHALCLHLQCSIWWEWVDSKSNIADGLSRLGLEDPWTRQQGWKLSVAVEPPWMCLADTKEFYRKRVRETLGVQTSRQTCPGDFGGQASRALRFC